VNVKPYAHPQPEMVLKHLMYVRHGCGIQFESFFSLNQSVVVWLVHVQHQEGFQPTFRTFITILLIDWVKLEASTL
jgi:hypothetical protein